MKKFLTKKATMIGSIVAAAVVFVLLLAFCIRPVSVGYTYSYKGEYMGANVTVKAHVNTFDKVTLSVYDKDGEKIEKASGEYWYLQKDGIVITSPYQTKDLDKDDWKEMKEDALEDWDKEAAEAIGMKVNAFKLELAEDAVATNVGAYATVIVLAVVDVLLAGAAVASFLLSKKK